MPSIKIDIYNKEGKKTGSQEVPESILGLKENDTLVHQVYVSKLSNKRIPYAHTKTRGEIRGGGRKPWRQKGTGRARHGSIRSPIWRGGGVTFGPRNDRAFSKKVNKKMNRKAILTALSSKVNGGKLYVVDSLDYEDPKTKFAASLLSALKISKSSVLIYGTTKDNNFFRVFRNIPKTTPSSIDNLNLIDILNHANCVLSKEALNKVVEQYKEKDEKDRKEAGSKVKEKEKQSKT
ncbi:MAG: 50S ribosomal protein L4 [Candidatus Spechtbacterales bacterium]